MTAVKCIILAVFFTLFRLLFRYFSFGIYNGWGSLYIAMFIGTLAGLIVKYVLDQKFIFCHEVKDKKYDAKKFACYSLMGVFITIIFWGTEIAFEHLSQDSNAKYLGAVIGLSIGYVIKYFLDRKFVFIHKEGIV